MDVKARLQQLMDDRRWTIYRIAKESNIPWSTVRNMFKRNTDPSIQTLESLCHGLGMTLSQFFDTEGNMGISPEQNLLLKKWSMLPEEDKKLVLDLMDSLIRKAR